MHEPVTFLHACAHTLSAMSLYPEGHVSRERALDSAYQALLDLLSTDPKPEFSFLGKEVVLGETPLREMRDWEWSGRLASIGIERMEFDETVTRVDLDAFLEDIATRIGGLFVDSSEARHTRSTGIRYGVMGVGEEGGRGEDIMTAALDVDLGDEVQTVRWLQDQIQMGGNLALGEAETVVRTLSVAMHGEQRVILPLLRIREYDEYTTTHALNVSVLAMGLAEWLELGAKDVRAFGNAGLLHDLGKIKVPKDVLTKPGKLTAQERAVMNTHPVEGARIIIESEEPLDLAAVVAYEHHIMINGGGYPALKYPRDCHYGSKLVHICDVYDALRTDRPYRSAWPPAKVVAYIEERSGIEFDGDLAHAFTRMISTWEPQLARLGDSPKAADPSSSQPNPTQTDSAPTPP